jgi:hypothetical protein
MGPGPLAEVKLCRSKIANVAAAGETCAVHVGMADTVHTGTLILFRSDVNGKVSPPELAREWERT